MADENTVDETTEETTEDTTEETTEETTEDTAEEEDPTIAEQIVTLAAEYFARVDETITTEYITVMVNSLIDNYKNKRNYPDYYTDEMIEEDVNRYFGRRKYHVANYLIPEEYGRIGAEGLSMLTDAGTTRMWTKTTILGDVTPICEVV